MTELLPESEKLLDALHRADLWRFGGTELGEYLSRIEAAARAEGHQGVTISELEAIEKAARAEERARLTVERLAVALESSTQLRGVTGRMGRLNGAWYASVAEQVLAAMQAEP